MIAGLDVSHYQGVVDWGRVADSGRYAFAYFKASQGVGDRAVDAMARRNCEQARLAALSVGAYCYLDARFDAELQARAFLDALPADTWALPGMLPPALDLEEGGFDSGARALAWLHVVEEARGVRPLVYTSAGFAARTGLHRWPELAAFDLWVAHWDVDEPHLPAPWSEYVVWQHSSRGVVPGVRGFVDLNVARALPGSPVAQRVG